MYATSRKKASRVELRKLVEKTKLAAERQRSRNDKRRSQIKGLVELEKSSDPSIRTGASLMLRVLKGDLPWQDYSRLSEQVSKNVAFNLAFRKINPPKSALERHELMKELRRIADGSLDGNGKIRAIQQRIGRKNAAQFTRAFMRIRAKILKELSGETFSDWGKGEN